MRNHTDNTGSSTGRGRSTLVMEAAYARYSPLITKSWMQNLQHFLHSIGGKIQMLSLWIPQPTSEHVINLMEAICARDLSDETKYIFNICRLRKRVYYLGDLLNPQGNKVRPHALQCTLPIFHQHNFPQITIPKKFNETWA